MTMGKALQTKVTKVKSKKTIKKAGVKQEDLPSEESSTAQEVDEPESEEAGPGAVEIEEMPTEDEVQPEEETPEQGEEAKLKRKKSLKAKVGKPKDTTVKAPEPSDSASDEKKIG